MVIVGIVPRSVIIYNTMLREESFEEIAGQYY
jgi:hypothetical protein